MVTRTFYAIDSEALSVTHSTTQGVGDSIINNSDSPDGTTYMFGSGYTGTQITVDDTGGSSATLEDDDHLNHTITDGAGLLANGDGIEAESLIYLKALDEFGNPTGPIITVTVFSRAGDANDVWGFASDAPLMIGAQYEKVGGSNTGTGDYANFQISGDGIVDGTGGDDAMGAGYTDDQTDAIDSSDGIDDIIYGYVGDDTIDGGAGNDTIFGDGDHTGGLTQPTGPDTYNDDIDGGVGDDYIDGGYGADSIDGGTGHDTLIGGAGVDTINGGDGADLIHGDFDDTLDSFNSPGFAGGTDYELADSTYDGSGKVEVQLQDFSGGSQDVQAIVNFKDDVDPGAAPLTLLEIKNIGNKGAATDEDIMHFDMSLFDDDFVIKLGSEGAEDRIIFENVISSTMDGDNTMITYLGKDGLTHVVTVEKTVAQIEIITGTTDADFASDGDLITGGAGDDTIDGGFGSDSVSGGADNDTFLASSGNDTVDGGTGQDTYSATGGTTLSDETLDVSVNGAGDGTVQKINDGSTDHITSIENFIAGEAPAEADSITLTDAVVVGTITGLNDSSVGTFTTGAGQVVAFGGAGQPTVNDILSGSYIHPTFGPVGPKGAYQITGGEEDGAKLGNISFQNFEDITFGVVCFAGGTHIETADGEARIETLKAGDLVATLDHGLQPIRWIGSTIVAADAKYAPVRIAAGALGNHRDLMVSPQHRMLLEGWQSELLFGDLQTLAPAIALLNDTTIRRHPGAFVEYHHMLFDTHEIVYAEGALSESFHPGHVGMGSFCDATRAEILDLFPSLATQPNSYGAAARLSLKPAEARLLAREPGIIHR